jgi:DHA2 family metal-tetracycline-proton antiporter-like MFS transporter
MVIVERELPRDVSRARNVLLVACASVFFSVLNGSIVNVTLPMIGQDLGIEPGQVGWVMTAYILVYAVAIPVYGRLADRYGARRFFLAGQSVFALGSLLCALAPSYPLLLVARVIQAGGGAAIPALAVVLLGRAFPPSQRGTAMGTLSTALGVGAAIGPTLGGVVSDMLGWHAIFVIGALAGFLVPVNWVILPRAEPRGTSGLDLWGGLFLALATGGVLLAATEGTRVGWGSPLAVWAGVTSAVGLVALVIRQRTAESPFIPRDLLRNRRYLALGLTSFAAMTAFVGPLIGMPLFLANINGLAGWQIGLVLLPNAVLNAALGIFVGRLVDRIGGRLPVRTGLIVMMISVIGLSTAAGAPAWVVAALMGLHGVGMVFVSTPLSTVVSMLVRPERLPSAQSMNTMLFFLGGSFGTTLVTAVVAARAEATVGLNPFHGTVGVGYSDAFLLLSLPLLVALALSATIPDGAASKKASDPAPGSRSPRNVPGQKARTRGAFAGDGN